IRVIPSKNATTLPFGIRTVLCTLASVPTPWRSAPVGLSTLGSSCATTPKYLSELPLNDSSSASELSRPTGSGITAPGKRTVSLTGKMGSSDGTEIFFLLKLSPLDNKVGQRPYNRPVTP